MKKDSFHPSDHSSDQNLENGFKDSKESLSIDPQKANKDMSITDLDNIFFSDDNIDDLLDRDSSPPSNSPDPERTSSDKPKTTQESPTQKSPTQESRIKVEDATPIPVYEENQKKTSLPEIDLSRKLTDFRLEIKKRKAKSKQGPGSAFFSQLSDKSSADITKVFVPADRIDEKGNVLPEKPDDTTGIKKISSKKGKIESLFTILLSYGRRIHFKKTIELCSEFLKITPQEAGRRLRFGKGILFEHVTEDTALLLQKKFLAISQGIRIIQENKLSNIPEAKEVMVWLFSRRHFSVQTENEKLVLPWEGIQLLSCGNVRLHYKGDAYKKILDIIMINPFIHLRIWDTTFDYKRSGITERSLGKTNFLNLIKVLKKFTKNARLSPSVTEILDTENDEPRHFESLDEFDNYTRWLHLSFVGTQLR